MRGDAYQTPYKHPSLILAGSGKPGTFDEIAVDLPFVIPPSPGLCPLYPVLRLATDGLS